MDNDFQIDFHSKLEQYHCKAGKANTLTKFCSDVCFWITESLFILIIYAFYSDRVMCKCIEVSKLHVELSCSINSVVAKQIRQSNLISHCTMTVYF